MLRRILGLAVLNTVSFLSGCNTGNERMVSVTGSVTLDGKPIPDVIVTFVPRDQGRAASGVGDQSGKFSLSTFGPGDGAFVGSYKVAIMPKNPPPMPGAGMSNPGTRNRKPEKYSPPIPNHYALPNESGFTAEVRQGMENMFTFDLKSK